MSDNTDNIKETGHISRQAMAWLRDHKLPPAPISYDVAFELFHNPNPELKLRVEQLEGTTDELIEGIQQIYKDFVITNKESELKQLTLKIDNLANNTLYSVSDTQDHLKAYSITLEEIEPTIEATSGDAIMNVISVLLKETKTIHKHAESLENKLKQATSEIRLLQSEHLAFKDKASHDPLTRVLNRTGLTEAFEKISEEKNAFPMSLIMADIDHFKSFNDDHGHLIGDKVLKLVASTLKKNIKRSDIVTRFGGEEFLLLLPSTDLESGVTVAESLRQRIKKLAIKKRNSDEYLRRITISIGVCEIHKQQQLTDGIERADRALYRSKNEGRNKVSSD